MTDYELQAITAAVQRIVDASEARTAAQFDERLQAAVKARFKSGMIGGAEVGELAVVVARQVQATLRTQYTELAARVAALEEQAAEAAP